MSSALMKFINSPTGPKTTHFWGPVANWGFVLAGLEQTTKPEHMISGPMTGALTVYSGLFMRFAWRVQPRNYILLACHTANGSVQVRVSAQLRRDTTHERAFAPSPEPFPATRSSDQISFLSHLQGYNFSRWYMWSRTQEAVTAAEAGKGATRAP